MVRMLKILDPQLKGRKVKISPESDIDICWCTDLWVGDPSLLIG